jgi:hypothetical protein
VTKDIFFDCGIFRRFSRVQAQANLDISVLICLVRVSQQNYFMLSSIMSGEGIEVSAGLLYNEQLKPFS